MAIVNLIEQSQMPAGSMHPGVVEQIHPPVDLTIDRLPGLAALGITAASVAEVAPGYLSARGKRSVFQDLRRSAGRY